MDTKELIRNYENLLIDIMGARKCSIGSLHNYFDLHLEVARIEKEYGQIQASKETLSQDTKEYIEQQEIEERVIEKIQERRAIGMKKYGVSVKDNPLKLSEWLNHLQEELLDASIYVKKLKDATANLPPNQYIDQKKKEFIEQESNNPASIKWEWIAQSITDSFNQGRESMRKDAIAEVDKGIEHCPNVLTKAGEIALVIYSYIKQQITGLK